MQYVKYKKLFHINHSEATFLNNLVKNSLQTSTFLSAIRPCLVSVASAWSRSFVNSFISPFFSCIAAPRVRNSANAFSSNSRQLLQSKILRIIFIGA